MVEVRWRFCNNLNPHKYVLIRIIRRNQPLRVEGGGIKQQKISGRNSRFFKNIKMHKYIYTLIRVISISYVFISDRGGLRMKSSMLSRLMTEKFISGYAVRNDDGTVALRLGFHLNS